MAKAEQLIKALYQQAVKNEHCDVKITAHGKVYGAHRGVLVEASPYFKALFSGSFKESLTGEISFSDIVHDAEMVDVIREFIYLGRFDKEAHAAEEVLQVASLLLLDDLVKPCQQMLLEQLTLDNVLHTWTWAHLYNLKPLEEVCRALCRSRFHDTIIHQPDAMKVSVDFLCHMIKERVLDFVDESTKLTFMQSWLWDHTRKELTDVRETMFKISRKVREVEPKMSSALQELDFLSKSFQSAENPKDKVDCIMSVNDDEPCTKLVTFCDLNAGKWYETRVTLPQEFSTFMTISNRFLIFQNEKKDELYAFDNVTNMGTFIFLPTFSLKESHHIFVLGGIVYLFVTVPKWARSSMDNWGYETNISGISETEGSSTSLHDSQFHGGSSNDASMQMHTNTFDDTAQVPELVVKDLKTLEVELLSIIEDCLETENHQVDLSQLNNRGTTHCLLRLSIESPCHKQTNFPSEICQICKMESNACSCTFGQGYTDESTSDMNCLHICENSVSKWKLVSEKEDIAPNLLIHETREIGGKLYIMVYGTTKNSECSESGVEEEKTGPFWFCVQSSSDTNRGGLICRLPDPPDKRTPKSRVVNWSLINVVKIKGHFGLRSYKSPARYSIYFDDGDWRWKWVPYKTEFDVEDDNYTSSVNPSCMSLQIEHTDDRSYQKCGLHHPIRLREGRRDRRYSACCDYPYINQFWRHESQKECWKELHPPPFDFKYFLWDRVRVSQSLLGSLDLIKPRITSIGGKRTDSEDGERPFAHYKFIDSKATHV